MKLWRKGEGDDLDPLIEAFTVGNDHLLDQRLVPYDCRASTAHAKMLCKIGVLTDEARDALCRTLEQIAALADEDKFPIEQSDEDCHTAIENHLIKELGDVGKTIHTARSRNDQVLTALRLYEKDALGELKQLLETYRTELDDVVHRQGTVPLPGYTHTQRAMPASVAMWAGSFADGAAGDVRQVDHTIEMIDQSPLGSAAGFGVPVLGIDRQMTADILGFAQVMDNPMSAQLSRGKFEAAILGVCAQIMYDLNKLASDLILFNTREFGFVELDERVCTGSSIMPQKKNPDVLELLRAKYHEVLGEEFKIKSLGGNLISGYHRDLQLTKGALFNGIDTTASCLKVVAAVLGGLRFNESTCRAAMTDELYATERAYTLVDQGVPFREAYQQVAAAYRDKGNKGNP